RMRLTRTSIGTRPSGTGGTRAARAGQMRPWIVAGALVLGACGCTASHPARPAAGEPSPARSSMAPGMQMTPAAQKATAVGLRIGMEELFGQDVVVGIRVTRRRRRGATDVTQADGS